MSGFQNKGGLLWDIAMMGSILEELLNRILAQCALNFEGRKQMQGGFVKPSVALD